MNTTLPKPRLSATVRVGSQGRIVIPAELRNAMGIEPGEVLVARVEGRTLVLESRAESIERIRKRFAHLRGGPSVVDELIAERRREAAREDAES